LKEDRLVFFPFEWNRGGGELTVLKLLLLMLIGMIIVYYDGISVFVLTYLLQVVKAQGTKAKKAKGLAYLSVVVPGPCTQSLSHQHALNWFWETLS
jgi:hypothetical protein